MTSWDETVLYDAGNHVLPVVYHLLGLSYVYPKLNICCYLAFQLSKHAVFSQ